MSTVSLNAIKSLAAQANAASTSKDWQSAANLWADFLTHDGNDRRAILACSIAHRELGDHTAAMRVLANAAAIVCSDLKLLTCKADLQMRMRDWPAALQSWLKIRDLSEPTQSWYWNLIVCHRQLKQIETAATVVSEALKQFPTDLRFLKTAAEVQSALNNHELAARYRQLILDNVEQSEANYLKLGDAYTTAKDPESALQTFAKAATAYPNSLELIASLGACLERSGYWDQAAAHYQRSIERLGESAELCTAHLRTLRKARQLKDAEKYLSDYRLKLPAAVGILQEQARLAGAMRQWALSLQYWKEVVSRDASPESIGGYASVLRYLGQHAEAERIITQAITDHPSNLALKISQAQISNDKGEWQRAVEQWGALTHINPSHPAITRGLREAVFSLRAQGLSQANTQAELPPASDEQAQNIALVTRFESIGENCEFGLFQRAVGAEPLGLLRFAGITPDHFVKALSSQLSGIGNPNFTRMNTEGTEYVTRDTRYGMAMHTFITPGAAEREKIFEMACKKIQFLRRKLIEDLEEGSKILVYSVIGKASAAQREKMLTAVKNYGPNKILFVYEEGTVNFPANAVTLLSEDMAIGIRPRRPENVPLNSDIPISAWLAICRDALSVFRLEKSRDHN